MTIIMIDPMVVAYAAAYHREKFLASDEAIPLSEEILDIFTDMIGECCNSISLAELEELAAEEEEGDA
jgi:hypothetical protein